MYLKTTLKSLGFSENESLTYLALMDLGEGTAFSISKKAKLPKSTVADILKNLNQKKIVSIITKNNRKTYFINSPEIILESLKEKERIAQKIMPELRSRYMSKKQEVNVRYFEGDDSIETVLTEILSEETILRIIGNVDMAVKAFPEYFPRFTKERVQRKIPLQVILTKNDPWAEKTLRTDQKSLRKTKVIPEKRTLKSIIFIWNNKTAFVSVDGQKRVVLIDDVDVYETQKEIFDFLWESVE